MAEVIGLRDFMRRMDAVSKAYERLPNEIAAIAVKFSKERFRDQAWLDNTREPWKQRSRKRVGKSRSQTLLVDKGRLKRSIRKISASPTRVVIGTDVPYAQIHNEGGTIKGVVTVKQHNVRSYNRKAYTRQRAGRSESIKAQNIKGHSVKTHRRKMNTRIPARPFIGQSEALEQQLITHITNRFTEAFNKQP